MEVHNNIRKRIVDQGRFFTYLKIKSFKIKLFLFIHLLGFLIKVMDLIMR